MVPASRQITFLANVQRLLGEGSFSATYKFSLLIALADLAVEHGDDSAAPLTINVKAIAEKFVTFYWRQAAEYRPRPAVKGVLAQNRERGKAAGVVRLVREMQTRYAKLEDARRDQVRWRRLIASVASTIKLQPLWKLQLLGGESVPFLYADVGTGDTITLLPGVAWCLRRHYALVVSLVRTAWLDFVRALPANNELLGSTQDLAAFMFGADRAALEAYRPILLDLQHGDCFYCERTINAVGHVDHFVPWSRYSLDLGHNFVLAHDSCNMRKGDRLAAVPHLARWCERNAEHGPELEKFYAEKKLVHDERASREIARWAYSQVEATHGHVWMQGDALVELAPDWRALLAC